MKSIRLKQTVTVPIGLLCVTGGSILINPSPNDLSMKISQLRRKNWVIISPPNLTHAATWLSWPHKEASWPGKIDSIYPPYCLFIKALAENETVHINVLNEAMKSFAIEKLQAVSANMESVEFYTHPTNDAWCRDHGPAFLINPVQRKKIIVDWDYNAWGNKYPPYDLDDVIPTLLRQHLICPFFIRALSWKAAQWISTAKER